MRFKGNHVRAVPVERRFHREIDASVAQFSSNYREPGYRSGSVFPQHYRVWRPNGTVRLGSGRRLASWLGSVSAAPERPACFGVPRPMSLLQ
jgi:hypothetical protein